MTQITSDSKLTTVLALVNIHHGASTAMLVLAIIANCLQWQIPPMKLMKFIVETYVCQLLKL
jgi:hypothetical protein